MIFISYKLSILYFKVDDDAIYTIFFPPPGLLFYFFLSLYIFHHRVSLFRVFIFPFHYFYFFRFFSFTSDMKNEFFSTHFNILYEMFLK